MILVKNIQFFFLFIKSYKHKGFKEILVMNSLKLGSKDPKKNTSNEAKVIRRNIVENSMLVNKLDQIERERIFNWKNLMDNTLSIRHSLDSTKLSTGSAFSSSRNSNDGKLNDMLNSHGKSYFCLFLFFN